jgi:hypothetical protein
LANVLNDVAETEKAGWPFKPSDLVVVGVNSAAALMLSYGRPAGWEYSTLIFLSLAAGQIVVRLWARKAPGRFSRGAAAFFPAIAIPIGYDQLNPLADMLHLPLADGQLQQIDRWMFGVEPTLWIAPRMTPALNDLMMAFYLSYFLWPVLIGAIYFVNDRMADFDRWSLAVNLFFALNYAGYLAVPAIGPRFALVEQFGGPIQGRLWAGTLATAIGHSPYIRDCFPSGHAGIALMVIYESRRRLPRLYRVILPCGIGLILSTVALRFHYTIDLVAAVPLAAIALWLGSRVAAESRRRALAGASGEALSAEPDLPR